MSDPYLYLGGYQIKEWTPVQHMTGAGLTRNYWVGIGSNGALTLNADEAQRLALALLTTLYDKNELSMETAEQVQYLASAVLADNEIVVAE